MAGNTKKPSAERWRRALCLRGMGVLEVRFVSINCEDRGSISFYQATRLRVLDNASLVVTEDTNLFDF
jgi:hypothetical protein